MLIYILFVSGVVLANASLDIAFHDTVLIIFFSILMADMLNVTTIATLLYSNYFYLNNKNSTVDFNNNDYNNYIKMFWVGLMDGDGSIQVNHWRNKSLQYRLVIKLSNLGSNYNMFIKIAKVIGGTVRRTGKNKHVIWVEDSKENIQTIIKIYDAYPPLTSRIICQLGFLKTCLTETSVNTYMLNRNFKYNGQLNIIKSNTKFNTPCYFKEWLSGFIEAEGCFSVRENNNHSFSIGQNNDVYLINSIKRFFGLNNKVRNPYGKFYVLEVYKKDVLLNIINHCTNYPLLGEKLKSLEKINQKLR